MPTILDNFRPPKSSYGNSSYPTFLDEYIEKIRVCALDVETTDEDGDIISRNTAYETSLEILSLKRKAIYFIGNGGSASIAGHMATDFSKNGSLPALYLGDPSLVTCLSNDLGYEEVYAMPISQLIRPEDVLVAISSSGNSQNIINGVNAAKSRGSKVITFSGFSQINRLRCMGDLNWYVKSMEYGIVENVHQIIMHSFLDHILLSK